MNVEHRTSNEDAGENPIARRPTSTFDVHVLLTRGFAQLCDRVNGGQFGCCLSPRLKGWRFLPEAGPPLAESSG
jgi:hypothetical protein